jgi:Tol biopolymer transport system component
VRPAQLLTLALVVLAATAAGAGAGPREPPLVVYESGGYQIWVVRADGNGRRRLPLRREASQPSLSPDGTRVAFTRPARGNDESYSMGVFPLNGGRVHDIYSADGGCISGPRWSPGGRLIAFNEDDCTYYNDADLWVATADGSRLHRLRYADSPGSGGDGTMARQQESSWMWSPDGRFIALQWGEQNRITFTLDVEIVNVKTGQVRVLAPGREPAWSPDGRRIAFVTATGIDVIDVDGSHQRTLVRHPFGDDDIVQPSWSPDGKMLAYWTGGGSRPGERPTLELVAVAPHSKPRPLFRLTDFGTYRPEWSSDSRTLLVSTEEAATWLVPVQPGQHPRFLAFGDPADWANGG